MAQRLVDLGEVEADTISAGEGAILIAPVGTYTLQGEDTSASGSYDETANIKGSVDGRSWNALGTMTTDGDVIAVTNPYQYLQLYQAGGTGTAARTLKVWALVIEE